MEGQVALRIPTTVERGPKARVRVLKAVPLLVRVRGLRDLAPVRAPARPR